MKTESLCHYCFEGKCHSELCGCNCPACFEHIRQYRQNEFNKHLYKAIKEANECIFESIMRDDDLRSAYISSLKKGERIGKVPSLSAKQCVPQAFRSSRALSAKDKLWKILKNWYQTFF